MSGEALGSRSQKDSALRLAQAKRRRGCGRRRFRSLSWSLTL